MQHEADLDVVFAASDLGARHALAPFGTGVAASTRRDGSPVTDVDHAVERLVRDAIAAHRPEDEHLGEETGAVGRSARVWIIDPIDGTSAFVGDDPHRRVQLALAIGPSRGSRRRRPLPATPPADRALRRWLVRWPGRARSRSGRRRVGRPLPHLDHAPWILLVEEAACRFTPRSPVGSPADGGGLYSNRAPHDDLLDVAGFTADE